MMLKESFMDIVDNSCSVLSDIGIRTHLTNRDEGDAHKHIGFEIVYVVYGSIEHIANDKPKYIQNGDMILLRPSDVHTYRRDGAECSHRDILIAEELFQKICDFLNPELYARILAESSCLYCRITDAQLEYFESTLQYINNMTDKNVLTAHTEIRTLINGILGTIVSTIFMPDNEVDQNAYPIWLKQILTRCTYKADLNVGMKAILADIAYDRSYVCRMFKKYTGHTITEHMNKIRLSNAEILLKNTNMPISEIIEYIGFTNHSYFIRLFKKTYAKTPLQYRLQIKRVAVRR
jgi:AraC family cel operon transcriptional repressor